MRDFEERLNPLRLAEMGIKISQDIDSVPSFHLLLSILASLIASGSNRPCATP